MDRRNFLKFLGMATVGGAVAYSFPSIIVPKNLIIPVQEVSDPYWGGNSFRFVPLNASIKEIYPKLIEDIWFKETPFLAYLRDNKKLNVRSTNHI